MASSNAVGNAREFISPSDLTFSWGSCHRCLWLNYNHGLRIRGKYDLLIEFADGTFGIIDCKFQAKDSDKTDLYQPQLEAYAFALENPATGDAKKVSLMGLLVWSLLEPAGDVSKGFGLKLKHTWRPIERNPAALATRLTDFITVVSGQMPAAKDNCEMCNYLTSRREFIGAQ